MNTKPDSVTTGWEAKLALSFRSRDGRTILAHRRHSGPLQVQRPFYPEAEGACHVYLLHPPGGVAGGDVLSISAQVDTGAHALLTTPAASKLYRNDGVGARIHQELGVAEGARLEWLPQETIVFDGASVSSVTHVTLDPGAGFIGWEIVCLGRRAAGEQFMRGVFTQRFEIHRAGEPLWWERNAISGSAAALHSQWGFAGHSVTATMVAVGYAPHAMAGLRAALGSDWLTGEFAATQLRDVIVCRYLGDSAEHARAGFTEAWRILRSELWRIEALPPRIWAT